MDSQSEEPQWHAEWDLSMQIKFNLPEHAMNNIPAFHAQIRQTLASFVDVSEADAREGDTAEDLITVIDMTSRRPGRPPIKSLLVRLSCPRALRNEFTERLEQALASLASPPSAPEPPFPQAGEFAAVLRKECGLCSELSSIPLALLAVESGQIDILREMVEEKGAQINYEVTMPGPTPLGRACSRGLTEMVRYLVSKGADLHSTDHMSNGCISRLVHCSEPDQLLEFLLDEGANINKQNHSGDAAMHLAAETPTGTAFLLLLIEKGADIYVQNESGHTPLAVAIKAGNIDAVDIFLAHGEIEDLCKGWGGEVIQPALLAVESTMLDMLKKVVQNGARINYDLLKQGPTSLGMACSLGLSDMVSYLFQQGADPNATDHMGNNCISRLVYCSEPGDLLESLLGLGVSIDHQNINGEAAVHLAAESLSSNTFLQLLAGKGANIDVCNKSGYTPLAVAVKGGNMDAVNFLLEHGASPECCSKWGDDIVQLAALSGSEDMYRSVLNRFNPSGAKRLDTLDVYSTMTLPTAVYSHLQRALQARTEAGIERRTVLSDIYEPVRHISTLEDLEAIQGSRILLSLYALYVRESVLGSCHPMVSEGFVTLSKVRASLPYLAYALKLRHESYTRDGGDAELHDDCVEVLQACCALLTNMGITQTVGDEHYQVFDLACEEMAGIARTLSYQTRQANNLVSEAMAAFTYISGFVSCYGLTPQVQAGLTRVIETNPCDHSNGNLLHHAVETLFLGEMMPSDSRAGGYLFLMYPCVLASLFTCYARSMSPLVEQVNKNGLTVLQELLQRLESMSPSRLDIVKSEPHVETAIRCMLRAGARTNVDGHQYILEHFWSRRTHSPDCTGLRCLTATVVRESFRNLTHDVLPRELIDFIYLH